MGTVTGDGHAGTHDDEHALPGPPHRSFERPHHTACVCRHAAEGASHPFRLRSHHRLQGHPTARHVGDGAGDGVGVHAYGLHGNPDDDGPHAAAGAARTAPALHLRHRRLGRRPRHPRRAPGPGRSGRGRRRARPGRPVGGRRRAPRPVGRRLRLADDEPRRPAAPPPVRGSNLAARGVRRRRDRRGLARSRHGAARRRGPVGALVRRRGPDRGGPRGGARGPGGRGAPARRVARARVPRGRDHAAPVEPEPARLARAPHRPRPADPPRRAGSARLGGTWCESRRAHPRVRSEDVVVRPIRAPAPSLTPRELTTCATPA